MIAKRPAQFQGIRKIFGTGDTTEDMMKVPADGELYVFEEAPDQTGPYAYNDLPKEMFYERLNELMRSEHVSSEIGRPPTFWRVLFQNGQKTEEHTEMGAVINEIASLNRSKEVMLGKKMPICGQCVRICSWLILDRHSSKGENSWNASSIKKVPVASRLLRPRYRIVMDDMSNKKRVGRWYFDPSRFEWDEFRNTRSLAYWRAFSNYDSKDSPDQYAKEPVFNADFVCTRGHCTTIPFNATQLNELFADTGGYDAVKPDMLRLYGLTNKKYDLLSAVSPDETEKAEVQHG